MKRFIGLLFLTGFVCFSFSQTITVKDKETNEPLELVTLVSISTNVYATTNISGQADISSFNNAGDIEIHRLGYKTELVSYKNLKDIDFLFYMTADPFSSDNVVVSATRWNQVSDNIPAKILTIAPIDIQLQNPQTAADLLNISGNVYIQKSQQGGGSPMIRGFATNRLLYTVDGVRMNTAIFRGGNIQNVISLDPFCMENTEILFGPGSVIYGSDAIGGVMSFQTLTPQFSLADNLLVKGRGLTRYSSANQEQTAHFDIRVGSRSWAMVTSISNNNFGDLRMGSDGPPEYLRPFYVQRQDSTDVIIHNDDPQVQKPSAYSQINLMQKVRYKPSDIWDLQYGFHYSETSAYARYDRHIRYRNGLPRYGEWSYGPQKWMMNNLSAVYSGKSHFFDQAAVRLAMQNFEESRISRDINKNAREIRTEEVDAWSANLDFTKSVNSDNTLYYGVETVWNKITSTGTNENIANDLKSPGPSRYPQSDWASYAVYITDEHIFSDRLTMQSGLRYNQFTLSAEFDTTFYPFPYSDAEINNGALTGSLGFVYRPAKEWIISSNLATAFRSPNVDDMGKVFDSEPGSVVVPNPELESEYAYNADFGIAHIWGDLIKVDLTAYYTILENALVRRDFKLDGLDSIVYDGTLSQVQAIQNAARTTVYGVQAGVEIKLTQGLTFSTDLNYQKGEEELDDGSKSPSRHAPPWFGVSRLNWIVNRLDMQLYAQYSGKKDYKDMPEEEKGKTEIYATDSNGNPYSPGWYTLNFKAVYPFAENLSLSAGIENITDQRYRPYSSGIAAAGRNFILSLSTNF
ncbi:MAG: TonB-dependent receptor [Calditrichaeota bacterium]|nr:TonB-dependent receptor [Calditrichota bacterium]